MFPERAMSVGTAILVILSVIAVGAVPTGAEQAYHEPHFDVEITTAPEVVATGDTVVINATVTNTGNAPGSQQVHLKDANHDIVDSVASPPVMLSPGESTNVTLTYQPTEVAQSGNVSVQSDDDYANQYIEVREGPAFEFSTNTTVDGDSRLNVSLNVTNTGGMAGTSTAWIAADHERKDAQQFTLEPDESTQVELEWWTAGTAPGDRVLTIGVGSNSVAQTIEIANVDVDDTGDGSTVPLIVESENDNADGTSANVVGHEVTRIESVTSVEGESTIKPVRLRPEDPRPVRETVGFYRVTVAGNVSETMDSVTLSIDDPRVDDVANETLLLAQWNGSTWVTLNPPKSATNGSVTITVLTLDTQVSVANGSVTITVPTRNSSLYAITIANESETRTNTSTATATKNQTETQTATETASQGETATASATPTETTTESAATESPTPTENETTTQPSETATSTQEPEIGTDVNAPGFGVVLVLVLMLLGSLYLTTTRRE